MQVPARPTPPPEIVQRVAPPLARRYLAALAAAAAALAISLALSGFISQTVFIFFFAAVTVTAWYGGRGPSLLVAALAVPLVNYFFVSPVFSVSTAPADLVRTLVFLVLAWLIGTMRETLGAARAEALEAARALEASNALLQEQAMELEQGNEALQDQAVELEQQREEAETLAEELEEAQQRLRESMESQLAEAQALARMGSWEWWIREDRIRWSDEMYRVYGLEPGSPITLETYLARIHPDDRAGSREAVQASLESGRPFEFEHRVVRPDGAVRLLQARGRVEAGPDGAPARMSGTGQDVTEERAAAETARRLAVEQGARAAAEDSRRRLEAVLEGIGEAFLAVDAEWRITLANPRAGETLGHPVGALLGRSMWEAFPQAVGGGSWRELHRIRAEGRPGAFESYSSVVGAWLRVRAAPWEGGLSIFYEDVTDRRRAQEASARLAAIVETSTDAIFSKTLDGVVTSWNAGAERLYGYAAEEVVGRPVSMLAPPDRLDEIPVLLARLGRGERIESFETVRRRKDGTLVDVLLAISPLPDAEGRVAGASTIARDITRRKRNEARLRESEEQLRFLAEASRVLFGSLDYRATLAAAMRMAVPRLADFASLYLLDEDGRARAVDAAHADPQAEPRVRELVGMHTPSAEGGSPVSRVLAGGEAVLIEEMAEEAIGAALDDDATRGVLRSLAPRSVMAVPLRAEGRVVGVMSFAMGDSGRRYGPADLALAEELARRAATAVENARLHAAEQEARRAAEAAAERTAQLQAVTAALSEARTPADVGDVVIREGLTSLGAVAGWLVELSAGGDALEALRARGYPDEIVERFRRFGLDAPVPLADAVRTGEPVYLENSEERDRRYPLLHEFTALGNGAWVSVPLVVEGRAIGGIGLTFREARAFDAEQRAFVLALARQSAMALERARLFEAEQRARAEAEAANRAKFQFLTTMSHELRTPLNAIAGYVELLEMEIRGPLNEAQREYLAKVQRSQTHLLGLINDVLNFARIETGHVHFDVRDVPLDETLQEVETLIGPQVQARGLSYEYRRFDPACTVRADAEKVRQIILNLLSNAVKFTQPGGRIVMECEDGDGTVTVRVRDTGVGIPLDKQGTIFDPFVQVNAGYTRPNEGTGLGLAISRDLARAMGGELRVESIEGEGSLFTLTLPVGDPIPTSPDDESAASPASSRGEPR